MLALFTSTNTEYYKEFTTDIERYALGGFFRNSTSPNMYYYKGSTYSVGYKSNVFNNQIWILKQTGNNVQAYNVGVGTDGSEPLNHPTPLLYINKLTGFIYVIQNNFHVDEFLVWKSSFVENISEFTEIGRFGVNESYLGLLEYNGTNCIFVTRNGASSDYDQSIIKVDLDNASAYTETILTNAEYNTTNVRHYPCCSYKYGVSDYTVWGINRRKDTNVKYFSTEALITLNGDYDTIYNSGLSFNKTISTDGIITNSELDTEYNILGDPLDTSISISEVRMIQIGDYYYTTHISNELTNEYTITRTNLITNVKNSLLLDTDVYDDGVYLDNMTAMFYHGSYIEVRVRRENVTSLYNLNLEATTLTFIRDVDTPNGLYLGLPINLNEIQRGKRYMMIGRSSQEVVSQVPYTVTSKN